MRFLVVYLRARSIGPGVSTAVALAGAVDRHMCGDVLIDCQQWSLHPSDQTVCRLDNIPGGIGILRPELDGGPDGNVPKDSAFVHVRLRPDVTHDTF